MQLFVYVKIKNNHQEGKWKKIIHLGKYAILMEGTYSPLLP